MYRNKDEEDLLSDIILGEAVMLLLKNDAAISSTALIRQLRIMAASEQDTLRQRACRQAIAEVRDYNTPVSDGDNVTHLFTSEGPADDTQKH